MSGFWPELLPDFGRRTQLMGVLNVTPDSFSDGGQFIDPDAAIARGLQMRNEGADVIDIGGESTRPGAALISVDEELTRILPVIRGLCGLIPLSVDTNKSKVAVAAVAAGASIINDVSGGIFDPKILEVVAQNRVGFIIMHARAKPEKMQNGTWSYEGGVVHAVREALANCVQTALAAGIGRDRLMVDPGFGFGKTVEENCQLLGQLAEFKALDLPILTGTSRKSFLGHLTDKTVENRAFASAASVAVAAAHGASMVRIHDVDATRDVLRVVDACAPSLICD
jgi:dihydropteroate synthase